MAEELSLDVLPEMKRSDYIKAFKNKASWKKAKAVIFLVDYKLEGKKTTIAIPFKKEAEMKLEMKRLKKEKFHFLKKTGAGTIDFVKDEEGNIKAKIEIVAGGLDTELLVAKAGPLFEKINVQFDISQSLHVLSDTEETKGEEEMLTERSQTENKLEKTEKTKLKSVSPWTSLLDNAVLPYELKKILFEIFKEAENENRLKSDFAGSLITEVSKYYNISIRENKDERDKEAAKAALVNSLKEKKLDWRTKDAQNLHDSYLKENADFEPVNFSNPSSLTKISNFDAVEIVGKSPAPIMIPITSKNLKGIPLIDKLEFNAFINLTFKPSVIVDDRISIEAESKAWALESGSNYFSSMISTAGNHSFSSLDIDVIKGIWKPFVINFRISAPEAAIDSSELSVSLFTVSLSGELSGSELIKVLGTEVPDTIASVSVSFALSYTVKETIGISEMKVIDKIDDLLKHKNEITSDMLSDVYEKDLIDRKVKAIKSNANLSDEQKKIIEKGEKQIKKLTDKIENSKKLIEKTKATVAKLDGNLKNAGGKALRKVIGKNAAKAAVKVVGRFIPGLNVALLVWDGIEIGMFIYDWYNSPAPKKQEIIMDAIKKMPPRVQLFMKTIIKKYKTIPNVGDDIDKLEDFLYGLDQDAFNRLIQRLETINIDLKKSSGEGSLSDNFIEKMQQWSEPDFELSETDKIDHILYDIPSEEFKLKSSYVIADMNTQKGDLLNTVLIVDVFDKEKQYQTSLELRDKIKYTVLERKGDCLKMEQNSGNVFEIKGQKLYLRNEQRYWSISSMQWINEVYFNSQP
jgi:hypothetical protein